MVSLPEAQRRPLRRRVVEAEYHRRRRGERPPEATPRYNTSLRPHAPSGRGGVLHRGVRNAVLASAPVRAALPNRSSGPALREVPPGSRENPPTAQGPHAGRLDTRKARGEYNVSIKRRSVARRRRTATCPPPRLGIAPQPSGTSGKDVRVRNRNGDRAAEKRAERVGWRPQGTSQPSRSMDERLRVMNDRAKALEGRLRHHAEENANWHKKWDFRP